MVEQKVMDFDGALLNRKERAYILDQLTNSSFYQDEFGSLDSREEERLIISIFGKIQAQ